MRQHIIALAGYAGTGKDTVADLLVMHFGFTKLAFADALRAEVREAFGIDMSILTDPVLKNMATAALAMRRAPLGFLGAVALSLGNEGRTPSGRISDAWLDAPRTPRQVLQLWGTEYRRRQSANYWASPVVERIKFGRRDGRTRFVITDCRFDNEADAVRALGGRIWQVKRPGINGATTAEGAHQSATDGSQFKPDVVLNNSHDMRHLQQLVLSEFVAADTGLPGAKVTVAQ